MNIIVAVDKNWAIGKKGQLLVSLPSDMRFFRTTTQGKTVIMGRKTYESLPDGKPLANRKNVVLSKTMVKQDGITVVQNTAALARLGIDLESAFVIGGAEVYAALLPYCSYAFVTRIDAEFSADAYFPNLDETERWEKADIIYAFKENEIEAEIIKYYNTKPLKLSAT